MSKRLVQAGHFRAKSAQPLRNVLFYSPMIIWVEKGKKRLLWHEDRLDFTSHEWLVVPASHYLTFVNEPKDAIFHSRTLTFHEAPPKEWLEQSMQKGSSNALRLVINEPLAFCFNTLFNMAEQKLGQETQRQFLFGLYAELKQVGALHLLFQNESELIKERLARYLSVNPGDDHPIEMVASHFLMSRATLTRKLSAENTTYRQVLANVRMVYALSLMQQSRSQISVALSCGYRSEARFSHRFKAMFGLSPREYLQTL
jgi:AraC-like DNA-binding protein